MKKPRQIVNPRQQPDRRHYNRERRQYYRDEERDFREGSDYIPDYWAEPGDNFPGRLYADNQPWRQRDEYQGPYSGQFYTPSFDYGYRDNEYNFPGYERQRRVRQATGYGNSGSVQGRDFENWMRGNYENEDRYMPEDNWAGRSQYNRDFNEGLYDYSHHDYFNRSHRKRKTTESGDWFGSQGERQFNKLHNRSNRHLEIVRPFKDYGRNDYNESVGFGSNEMVYHNDDRFREY
jgi:hypothetical protein